MYQTLTPISKTIRWVGFLKLVLWNCKEFFCINFVSSANMRNNNTIMSLSKSLIKIITSTCPNTLPWGIWDKTFLIPSNRLSLIPQLCSLQISLLPDTKSSVFAKSA